MKDTIGKRSLDTLAQTGTRTSTNCVKPGVEVRGLGSDLTDEKLIKGRGKRKLITQHLMLNLIQVAEKRNNPKLIKAFWNTYYCQDEIRTSSHRAYSNYCKNKFCTVCLANRKAILIHKYLPHLRGWKNPYFVTLTIRSIPAKFLKSRIENGMLKAFRIILDRHKKRFQRKGGLKLIGVRSLECNFNSIKKIYNPHFHLIVPDKETAELLISEWLKLWTSKFAMRCGQHLRPVTSIEDDLIEVIKYGTKIFTQPDVLQSKRGEGPRKIFISALYNIIEATEGHRLFDRFGFNIEADSTPKNVTKKIINNYENWKYSIETRDWINSESKVALSNYIPSTALLEYLLSCTDKESE